MNRHLCIILLAFVILSACAPAPAAPTAPPEAQAIPATPTAETVASTNEIIRAIDQYFDAGPQVVRMPEAVLEFERIGDYGDPDERVRRLYSIDEATGSIRLYEADDGNTHTIVYQRGVMRDVSGGEKTLPDGTTLDQTVYLAHLVQLDKSTGMIGRITPMVALENPNGTGDLFAIIDNPKAATAEALAGLPTLLDEQTSLTRTESDRTAKRLAVLAGGAPAPTAEPTAAASRALLEGRLASARMLERSATPEERTPLNEPTPIEDYEALRAGPPEMTMSGEVVSIEDFVKNHVETGAFSDWLVSYAEKNGTLPAGLPPEGGARGPRAAEFQVSTNTIKENFTKLIRAGVPVGNLTGIKVTVGYMAPQEFARSQGVWEIKVPSATTADLNGDGATSLWVRGVVLATGDPAHPYVGVPVVHTGLDEIGGFDKRESTMRDYCRPYAMFSAAKDVPSVDEIYFSLSRNNPRYVAVIAALHGLGQGNEGFELPGGLSWTGPLAANPTKDVDPSLRPVTEADLGWLHDFIYNGRLDWEMTRKVILVDDRF